MENALMGTAPSGLVIPVGSNASLVSKNISNLITTQPVLTLQTSAIPNLFRLTVTCDKTAQITVSSTLVSGMQVIYKLLSLTE